MTLTRPFGLAAAALALALLYALPAIAPRAVVQDLFGILTLLVLAMNWKFGALRPQLQSLTQREDALDALADRLPTVLAPKTIDNDVIPIHQSLGAWTAAEEGARVAVGDLDLERATATAEGGGRK